jgi:replicative DNA helicase
VSIDVDTLAELAPPHDVAAEQAVLGAMMLSQAVADELGERLTAEDFYRPIHASIFDAIFGLSMRGEPTDPLAVTNELRERGDLIRVGGVPYLHATVESVPTAANGGYYADQIIEHAKRRRLGEAALKIARLARDPGEVRELQDQASQLMYDAVADGGDRAEIVAVGDLFDETMEHIEAIGRGDIKPGLRTGLHDLDRLTGGLRAGELIIPAGRTSMGKSVLTQNWCVNIARVEIRPVILFSVEMSKREMMQRLFAEVAQVSLFRLREGQLTADDRDRLDRARTIIRAAPLYLVDTCRTVPAIRSFSRRFRQREGDLAAIGVDYLQRLQVVGKRVDRHQEVGQFADDLKYLAQDLEMAVISPCQLNRGPETRPGKDANIPRLSDLRESGNLEQSADMVVLIHRPDYYDKAHPRAGEADLIVAKQRNGPTDTCTVAFDGNRQKFHDIRFAGPRPMDSD